MFYVTFFSFHFFVWCDLESWVQPESSACDDAGDA